MRKQLITYIQKELTPEEIYIRKMLKIESIGIVCEKEMIDLRDYFIEMLGSENGIFLYEQTMNFCSTNDGWNFNIDAAKLYGIDNYDNFKDPLAKYYAQ